MFESLASCFGISLQRVAQFATGRIRRGGHDSAIRDTKIGPVRCIRTGRLALGEGEGEGAERSTPRGRGGRCRTMRGEFQIRFFHREALAFRLRLNIGGTSLSHICLRNLICICVS